MRAVMQTPWSGQVLVRVTLKMHLRHYKGGVVYSTFIYRWLLAPSPGITRMGQMNQTPENTRH